MRAFAGDVDALARARTVVGYVACDGEIDVTALLDAARARGASVALPRGGGPVGLELVVTAPLAPLTPSGRGGVLEPAGAATDPATLPAPAVLLAPAVGVDRRGFRLGRGGGDYDRLIPALRALGWTVVAVCHASALCDALPVEAHDQRADVVLSDAGALLPDA